MTSHRLSRAGLWIALPAAALFAAACGAGDPSAQERPKAPPLASAATLEDDPYAISCGHVSDQLDWADETRRATVAIADGLRIGGLNRLQTTQSLFYAMTELCKGRAASYEPGRAAAEAVRRGRFRADLGQP